MKHFVKTYIVILIMVMAASSLWGKEEFKRIRQWDLGDKEIYKQIADPVITREGDVLIREGDQKSILITPGDLIYFGPKGEGPSDLYMPMATCHYGEDIAYLEFALRIKIFTKKGNTYTWKESKWLKNPHNIAAMNMLFYKDKWFVAGHNFQGYSNTKSDAFLATAFNNDGKLLKGFLKRSFKKDSQSHSMNSFLALNQNRIILMVENQLKAYEISADELKVLREIPLETPGFYKKMPEDFYIFKENHRGNTKLILADIEMWRVSYSAITNLSVDGNYLAVQIRTGGDKQKKFAMLFYDTNNFQLKKTVFIDDYFLGSRDGTYYFYANGNPGFDDEAGECIINLYSFIEEK